MRNSVSIQHGVSVTTPAGVFDCTYISIQDDEDGVLSWELWFNSTVQNYVKIVDRLPGSHSDTVVHELTGYDRPSVPTFLTETTDQDAPTFDLQWSEFSGVKGYQLLENGVEIYRGTDTQFEVHNRDDGIYSSRSTPSPNWITCSWVLSSKSGLISHHPFGVDLLCIVSQRLSTAMFSWDYEYEVDRFSLTVQAPDGTTTEVYNGSSSFAEVEDLEPGSIGSD